MKKQTKKNKVVFIPSNTPTGRGHFESKDCNLCDERGMIMKEIEGGITGTSCSCGKYQREMKKEYKALYITRIKAEKAGFGDHPEYLVDIARRLHISVDKAIEFIIDAKKNA